MGETDCWLDLREEDALRVAEAVLVAPLLDEVEWDLVEGRLTAPVEEEALVAPAEEDSLTPFLTSAAFAEPFVLVKAGAGNLLPSKSKNNKNTQIFIYGHKTMSTPETKDF